MYKSLSYIIVFFEVTTAATTNTNLVIGLKNERCLLQRASGKTVILQTLEKIIQMLEPGFQ